MDLLDDLNELDGDDIAPLGDLERINEEEMEVDEQAEEADLEEADKLLLESIKQAEDVHTVAKLYGSRQLNDVLEVF